MAGGVLFSISLGVNHFLLVIYLTIFALLQTIFIGLPVLLVGITLTGRQPRPHAGYISLYIVAIVIGAVGPWYSPFGGDNPEHEERPLVEDDPLADKHPEYFDEPSLWKTLPTPNVSDWKLLEINKSAAVVSLDLPEVEKDERPIVEQRFTTYRAALDYLNANSLPWVPSVQMADQKLKSFSDAALAAIEMYTQHDAEGLGGGRQVFLERLLDALLIRDANEAAILPATALKLSGIEPALPEEVNKRATELQERFLADEYASKPGGYYMINETLRRIFQQNRFCQQKLQNLFDAATAEHIASDIATTLQDNEALATSYRAILTLQSRTTNPPQGAFSSFLEYTAGASESAASLALFPPSGSVENTLYLAIYDFDSLPDESIMNRLIRAIREGEVDLTPDADSGWYAYQVYALETLLVPERAQEGNKLLLSKAYKERLIDAFQTMLTKQRELHLGFLFQPDSAKFDYVATVTPDLSVDPTATVYLRTARALRFLQTAVTGFLGETAWDAIRLDNGDRLADTLPAHVSLLYGLYLTVCDDLGMKPQFISEELTPAAIDDAKSAAKAWLDTCQNDAIYSGDVRYIVPVITDMAHSEVRYWMTTGIRLLKVKAEYARPPRFRVDGKLISADQNPDYEGIHLAPREFYLPVEEFAEATGPSTPYTREEFRALCDAAGSREDIIRAVENGRFLRPFRKWQYAAVLVLALPVLVWLAFRSRKWRADQEVDSDVKEEKEQS
jgi:hypothetical protein